MPITRYKGQPLPITVKFDSNPLDVYGQTYADIEDITMNFKSATDSDNDDAFLEKLLSTGGVVLDEPNHRFVMQISQADYANLGIETYNLVLAIKTAGFADYLEMKLADPKVEITRDENRK